MKKLRNLSLLMLVSIVGFAYADSSTPQALKGGDATGQTFFYARPQFQDAMPEKISLFRNDRALARDCGWGGAFQVVPFGGQTTNNDGKRLARYFMFAEKDQLTVASNGVANVDPNQGINRDVNPFDFNILYVIDDVVSTFQSTLIFKPRQSVVGAGFDYIQYFGCGDCPKWWGEISFPVLRLRNDMRLTETNIIIPTGATPAVGSAPNMTAAFTGQFTGESQTWQFGIINGRQQKTGVADVEIKIGYEYLRDECSYLYSYLGVLAPTGQTPKAKYVFEPILGENRHVGFLSGGSGGFKIWEGCGCKTLWFDCDVAWRYLFNRSETRSFDLYNRPWSRYMPVWTTTAAAAEGVAGLTPGINTFTQKMKVRPGLQFDVNWAFVLNTECGFQAEVGYNFWARTAERIGLSTPWEVGPAIAATGGNTITANIINRISNIGADFDGEDINITAVNPATPNTLYLIQPGDINLNSATAPACTSQIVYGTLGYSSDCWCWPVMFAAGGSYEWSKVNTALTRWTAWGKIGISI